MKLTETQRIVLTFVESRGYASPTSLYEFGGVHSRASAWNALCDLRDLGLLTGPASPVFDTHARFVVANRNRSHQMKLSELKPGDCVFDGGKVIFQFVGLSPSNKRTGWFRGPLGTLVSITAVSLSRHYTLASRST